MNRTTPNVSSSRAVPEDRSRLLDELLRRTLRIGDPRNPVEVAAALRQRYAAQALKLQQEATGVSVSGAAQPLLLASPAPRSDTPGQRQLERVRTNVEVDLSGLLDAPANREWKPELAGWRSAILRQLEAGISGATLAQDPARRDMAHRAIRNFGDYARLARLAGVLHLEMNHTYRRLASSLDEASGALRTLIGESLFDAGLADGGVILSVPLTDLRQRADSLLLALRQLASLEPDAEDEFGQSLASYGALLEALDAESASDLKPYLREESLGPLLDGIFDDLSSAVQRSDSDLLREIGATLPVRVMALRRLHDIAFGVADPNGNTPSANSSALSRFVHALNLFVQALDQPRAGARFIDLAVPLAMAAQQTDEADGETRAALRQLVNLRAELAREADCFLSCCGRSDDDLRTQVKLDFLLYHVDRAIDLYAQGEGYPDRWGDEENRAVAIGFAALNLADQRPAANPPPEWPPNGPKLSPRLLGILVGNRGHNAPQNLDPNRNLQFGGIAGLLLRPYGEKPLLTLPMPVAGYKSTFPVLDEGRKQFVFLSMDEMNRVETEWERLANTMAPRCLRADDGPSNALAGLELLTFNPSLVTPRPWPLERLRAEPPEVAALRELTVVQREAQATRVKAIADASRVVQDPQRVGILVAGVAKTALTELKIKLPGDAAPPTPTPTVGREASLRDDLLAFLMMVRVALKHSSAGTPEWPRSAKVLRDGEQGRDLLSWSSPDGKGLKERTKAVAQDIAKRIDWLLDAKARESFNDEGLTDRRREVDRLSEEVLSAPGLEKS